MRRKRIARAREKANSEGEAQFPKSGSAVPHFSWLVDVIAAVALARWPRKTAMELALRGDVSERQAKEIIARRATGVSGDTLAALITSDAGFALLAALMAALPEDERPAWWGRMKRQMALSEARRELEESRRRIERLEAESGGAG